MVKKGFTILVLDKGFVRYIDHMGTDADILEAARISYNSPSKGLEADKKLLEYLWRNRHTSPFEMVKVKLNIKLPIFIMRQFVRHRMQNINEVSARYTQLPNEFYIPTSWRRQDTKNKQGSLSDSDWHPKLKFGEHTYADATSDVSRHCDGCYLLYQKMIEAGIAREMARMVLPVNIYTEIYTCWDMKNLMHFMTLRDDSHAQSEIQEYSRAIKTICAELFPWTMEAFEKYKWRLDSENIHTK
jgi:thymidylate synthase (FAD)